MKTEYVILGFAIVFLVSGVTAFSGLFDEHISDAIFINPAPSSLTGGNSISEISIDLELEAGYTLLDEHGKNEVVGSTYEEIWEVGGIQTLLTSPSTLIVTTSGNDNGNSSTGARNVILEGLNGTYHLISANVTTNASVPQTSSESFIRIFRIYVDNVGALNWNENSIDITATTGGSNQGHIQPTEGESEKTQSVLTKVIPLMISDYSSLDMDRIVELRRDPSIVEFRRTIKKISDEIKDVEDVDSYIMQIWTRELLDDIERLAPASRTSYVLNTIIDLAVSLPVVPIPEIITLQMLAGLAKMAFDKSKEHDEMVDHTKSLSHFCSELRTR